MRESRGGLWPLQVALIHAPVIVLVIFLLGVPETTWGGVLAPSVPSEGKELVLGLADVMQRVRSGNRFLLQNELVIQGNRYARSTAEEAFDWKIQPVANLGFSKNTDSSARSTGVSGMISKKSSLGIATTLSPSVAYVEGGGVSSGVGLSLSVPLFRGFGKAYNYDTLYSADYALESSRRELSLAEVLKVLEAIRLSYEVVRQQSLKTMYRDQARRLQRHVVTIQLMERTGLGNQIDTYRVKIRQKDVQNQLAVARLAFKVALDRLKVLLALPSATVIRIEIPLTYEETKIGLVEAQEIASRHRLEREQSRSDLLEARRKSGVARERISPVLNLVASYRKNSFLEGLEGTQSFAGDYWSIGLRSDTDVARSSERAAYRQSLVTVRRRELQVENQDDLITIEVKKRLDALEKEAASIALRREQIVQARGKMRLAEIKFTHGMGNNFDFIEADGELLQARANLLRATVNYIVGQYQLRAGLGTLLSQ